MNDERPVEETVTHFFRCTSVERIQPRKYAVHAAVWCAELTFPDPNDDTYYKRNPLVTGSAAELSIEPMLPHLGDVDIMYYHSCELAIPQGHPPPTRLPAEFYDNVDLHEITDSHMPGYVYLQSRYLLTKCTDSGTYTAKEYDEEYDRTKISYRNDPRYERHGPASRLIPLKQDGIESDLVCCVRCLSWPPQASDWRTRARNNGWPDSATVDRIVSNGCDVVNVAHRQCRQLSLIHI